MDCVHAWGVTSWGRVVKTEQLVHEPAFADEISALLSADTNRRRARGAWVDCLAVDTDGRLLMVNLTPIGSATQMRSRGAAATA